MILDAYGRPVCRENSLEAQILEHERVEQLRESVAEEQSTPAAEDKQVGIGIRFIKAWDLVKSERLP